MLLLLWRRLSRQQKIFHNILNLQKYIFIMDSDELKNFITGLNSIFDKNYTLLSFDALTPDQLLQVLSDTLSEVDGSARLDLRQELLEDTIVRMVEMLRILKYKLNKNVNPSAFRQGLVQGDKKTIYPILAWLVANMNDLKKRSYLAQFLVKLDISPEILADPDITYLYEQYENRIEEFKSVHKESEVLKTTAMSIAELRSDIAAMESEKESVLKKIDKLKRRVESLPEKDRLLEAVKKLRLERDKRKELTVQEEQQRSQAVSSEQRLRRLTSQLREQQQNAGRTSAEDLLRRLEEECRVNAYLAQQKLPMELKAREDNNNMMAMVLNEQSLTRAHLDDLNFKIQQISNEIAQLMEAQMTAQNPSEDKNAPFRQQASIISRKKEGKAEQLSELRNQLSLVEEELTSKQAQFNVTAGESVPRGDEFKKYVNKLKALSAVYKKQKAELTGLKAEGGVLARTLDILSTRDQSVMRALMEEEVQLGIEGYRSTRDVLETVSDAKSDIDTVKGRTLENMSQLVVELSARVAAKKTQLEPMIAELRPLREEFREMSDQHEQKKRTYDSTAAGLENATSKLQQDVDEMYKEFDAADAEINKLESENAKAEEDLIKIAEEVKLYLSGTADAKKQSQREQLQQKINAEEKVAKSLKDEQTALKDLQAKSSLQLQYWKHLSSVLQCKIECFEEELKNVGVVRRDKEAETLILQQ